MAFEFQRLPPQVTLVGVQNDALLLPIRRASGVLPLAVVGNQTAEAMLDELAGAEGRELVYVRVAACAVGFVGLWLLRGAMTPFRVAVCWEPHA